MRSTCPLALTVFVLFVLFALSAVHASAAQLTVTTTGDGNDGVCNADCTLREAIILAAANDEIVFASPFFDSARTIILSTALPNINNNLTITGKGANLLNVQRSGAAPNFTVFTIDTSVIVTIRRLTISGGVAPNAVTSGGITNFGNLTVQDCAISGNLATNGSAVLTVGSDADTDLINCTISGNTSIASGVIFITTSGQATLTNTTVSGNTSGFGAVVNNGGTLSLISSTITGNTAPGVFTSGSAVIGNSIVANNGTAADLSGSFISIGYNLISRNGGSGLTDGVNNDKVGTVGTPRNPLLGSLASNGGPTQTHLPQLASPAIDGGNCLSLTSDQRGLTRPFDAGGIANVSDGCDIGAVERQDTPTAAGVTVAGRVFIADAVAVWAIAGARVILTGSDGRTRFAITGPFGYFSFSDVESGRTYVLTVRSKQHEFAPQVVQADSNLTEVNFNPLL